MAAFLEIRRSKFSLSMPPRRLVSTTLIVTTSTIIRMIAFSSLLFAASTTHALSLSPTKAAATATAAPGLATALSTTKAQPWTFQGHSVYAEVTEPTASSSPSFPFFGGKNSNKKKRDCSVVLIHGFGCSTYYWRETCRALTESGYTVHAVDLLGQGKSDKPDSVVYSTELWTDLVTTYVQERLPSNEKIVFMGNSVGSVVALNAAICPDITRRVKGVGLYNCGLGMNSMNLLKDPSLNPVQRAFFGVVFLVFNTLIFGNLPLLTYVLEQVVTKDRLRNALVNLYPCASDPQERVDDNIVDSFYYPAKDKGSPQALSQIFLNDAGPTPMELHEKSELGTERIPIHLIWGNQDGVTPLSGYVGRYYTELAADDESSPFVTMDVIDAGHIPFDEIPECNDLMVQWMNNVAMR